MKHLFLILGWNEQVNRLTNIVHNNYPNLEVVTAGYSKIESVNKVVPHLYLEVGHEMQTIKDRIGKNKLSGALNLIDRYIPLHAKIVDHYRLPGPTSDCINLTKDKSALHELMIQSNLSHSRPATIVTTLDSMVDYGRNIKTPFIIKPYMGAKSRGVYTITDHTQLHKVKSELSIYLDSKYCQSNGGKDRFLIEEFIEGDQFSITCYVDKNGHLHTINEVDIISGHNLGLKHNQIVHRTTPSKLSEKILAKASNLIQAVVNSSRVTSTFLHPELIVRGEEVFLIELNVRLGGLRGMLSKYANSVDIGTMVVQLALGQSPTFDRLSSQPTTASELWPLASGSIDKITYPNSKYVLHIDHIHRQGDRYVAPPQGSSPIAQIYTSHPKDSLATAQAILDDIQIEIA